MDIDRIVFWYESPPVVTAELIEIVAKSNKCEVYLVVCSGFDEERKKIGWKLASWNDVNVIRYEQKSLNSIRHLITRSKTRHVFNGLNTTAYKENSDIFFRYGIKYDVILERPNFYGRFLAFKKPLIWLKYARISILYRNEIRKYLVLGEEALKFYSSIPLTKKKLSQYIYTNNSEIEKVKFGKEQNEDSLRMLFVGRCQYSTRGVDLFKQFGQLKGSWTLDIVGDYGRDFSDLHRHLSVHRRVNFIGRWSMDKVVKSMAAYDVVLIPSRYEGYNLNIVEAFYAGVPCICTPNSGSNELVTSGGFGICVPRNRFLETCQHIINNRSELIEMKRNLIEYRTRFNRESLELYLISLFLEDNCIRAPWL